MKFFKTRHYADFCTQIHKESPTQLPITLWTNGISTSVSEMILAKSRFISSIVTVLLRLLVKGSILPKLYRYSFIVFTRIVFISCRSASAYLSASFFAYNSFSISFRSFSLYCCLFSSSFYFRSSSLFHSSLKFCQTSFRESMSSLSRPDIASTNLLTPSATPSALFF